MKRHHLKTVAEVIHIVFILLKTSDLFLYTNSLRDFSPSISRVLLSLLSQFECLNVFYIWSNISCESVLMSSAEFVTSSDYSNLTRFLLTCPSPVGGSAAIQDSAHC